MKKIQKNEVVLVGFCAVCGFFLISFLIPDYVTAIVTGVPSGLVVGFIACIVRRIAKKKDNNKKIQLTINSIDYAPEELYDQLPLVIDLMREIPGDDRPDYWLGKATRSIKWIKDNHEYQITHLVLAARWQGTKIKTGAKNLPVGIAYVTDDTLLDDKHLDFKKCAYVAIGISTDTTDGHKPPKLNKILSGTIATAFGKGKQKSKQQ